MSIESVLLTGISANVVTSVSFNDRHGACHKLQLSNLTEVFAYFKLLASIAIGMPMEWVCGGGDGPALRKS